MDVTNKSQHSERNLLTNFPGNNGVYNYNTSEKSKIEVERDIRAVQDEEFRKSLEAEKICRSRHWERRTKKREGYLKNLIPYRQSMFLSEPFMTEDTVLVCV